MPLKLASRGKQGLTKFRQESNIFLDDSEHALGLCRYRAQVHIQT